MLTQTEALIRCQNQFRSYERQHRAKCTPEGYAKAEVNADMARLCEAALSIEVTYSSGYLGVVEPRRDVRKALDNAILHPNPLVGAAACIIQEIEEVPGWADNASLITIRAHAWVLLQDLPDALSLPDPKPEGDDAAALKRYRAATYWVGADAWDGCSDCMDRLRWAAGMDLGRDMSSDDIAAAMRPFFAEHTAARRELKPEGAPAWRPEVRAFADLMEAQLKANDHKPGWKGENPHAFWPRLSDEALDLADAMENYKFRDGSDSDADHVAAIGKEAADVANFAMMIADVCGALSTPTDQQPTEEERELAHEEGDAETFVERQARLSALNEDAEKWRGLISGFEDWWKAPGTFGSDYDLAQMAFAAGTFSRGQQPKAEDLIARLEAAEKTMELCASQPIRTVLAGDRCALSPTQARSVHQVIRDALRALQEQPK